MDATQAICGPFSGKFRKGEAKMIIQPDFLDHWKTVMLCNMLDDKAAPLHVIRLWCHCQNRKTSTFSNGNPEMLKAICRYEGDPDLFWKAMEASGFVIKEGTDLVVKGWDDINAGLVNSWKNGKKGGRPKKETQTKPKRNPDKTQSKPRANPQETDKIREEKKPPPENEDPVVDGDGGGLYVKYHTAFKEELAGLGITTPLELRQACDRNMIGTPNTLVAALLEVTAREKAGSPSSNRKARVRSVIKDGVGSTYRKQAAAGITRWAPEPVILPTREEVEAGKAETLKAAQEFKAMVAAKRKGEADETDQH